MCRMLWFVAVAGAVNLAAFGQESAEDKAAAREARLEKMRQIAARFTVKAGEGEAVRTVPLRESPILRFNDPAREFHDATLWAWGDKGRPVCLLAIEQYKDSWFECISLTDEPLLAETKELKWQPKPPGIALQLFPDAPKPAKDAPRRLAQTKTLLGKLTVHEIGRTGSRYELRLMTTPLYRYADPEGDLLDGAIFAFAYGTNPELLAIIEARGPADAAKWHIAFARCGTAEPRVMLADMELFHLPYARQTKPTDAYWNFAHRFADEK